MSLEKPAYRADIDGLRAIAVLSVLLFHAEIPGFTGGYVGVDVFFVISGFLITSIVWREIEGGHFSIARFYERRARRIIPALALTLALTLIGGIVVLGVNELTTLAKSLLATLLFVSNFFFWRSSGYFEVAAEMQPLLHTWSLAIEEQFYLFWPIVLLVMSRIARGGLKPLLWAGTFLSLGASAVLVYLSPAATFYLLPTRAWELALGALAALGYLPSARRWLGNGAQWAAILLVLVPVFVYDKTTIFPGLTALAPCLGTVMLIDLGRSSPGTVSQLLERRPLVAIGLISYSLYLFHFPILVYLRTATMGELSIALGLAGLLASVALAAISYHVVEQPFRNAARVRTRQLWLIVAAANIALGAAALWTIKSSGFPQRFDPGRLAFLEGEKDIDHPSRACLNLPLGEIDGQAVCRIGASEGTGRAILWGDSHAAALRPAVDAALRQVRQSGTLFAFNACPPLLDFEPPTLSWADAGRCRERNRALLARVRAAREPSLVIVHAYWSSYARMIDEDDAATVRRSIERNLDALRRNRVVIVLDTPRADHALPAALAYGRRAPVIDAGTNDAVSRMLREAAAGRATVIDPAPAICPDRPCRPLLGGRPILSDDNHIAASVAAERVAPLLARELRSSGASAGETHQP